MQGKKPLISVIMPVYKTEKYLEASVESVVVQTYENIEIILVDDGSPDNSPYICDELAEKYDNVKVFHKVNGGLSDARNCGLKSASGKYVFFLDSDDTIDKNAISSMVEIAERELSDVVIPDRYYQCYEGENEKQLCHMFLDEKLYIEKPVKFATDVIIANGRAWRATSVLYRADVIKDNNCYFPKGYTSEDVVFNLLFMSFAKKCSFIKEPTLNYLKRAESITTSFNKDFFDTILYIDNQVDEFLIRNNIFTTENIIKKKSLFCRNYIVYLFSVLKKDNGLNNMEKKELVNSILNNEKVIDSMKIKMLAPYFDNRMLSVLIVFIHGLFKIKFKKLALLLIDLINCVG